MYIELVEVLRCPAAHEESSLVAAIERLEGRYIASGSLGCPVCKARYRVEGFVAHFEERATAAGNDAGVHSAPRVGEDALVRLAALLDARTPGAVFLLAGEWGFFAPAFAVGYDVQCLVVNPPPGVTPGDGVSIIQIGDVVPAATGVAAGAALDDAIASRPGVAGGIVRAVRGGGRVIGSVAVPLPGDITELARDDRHWVAERIAAPTNPVPLRRAR